MKKVLLALLGLILLAILGYFCFQNKAKEIQNDLVSSTNTALSSHGIAGVSANLRGTDLELTDIMVLKGEVSSLEVKAEAESLARTILGVGGVDNQLVVAQQVAVQEAVVEEVSKKSPKEIPVTVKDENPYIVHFSKNEDGKITLEGFVQNKERIGTLGAQAQKLFGKDAVTNALKVQDGAPEDWEHITSFSLERLHDVDYGEMNITNNSYEFIGHLPSPSKKAEFLDGIRMVMANPENKYGRYRGDYIITAPVSEPEVKTAVVEKETPVKEELPVEKLVPVAPVVTASMCQKSINTLLKGNKILFDLDKASIKNDSYTLLDSVIHVLENCHANDVEIAGHTDSAGAKTYNQRLSEARASSVKSYFVKQGLGERKLHAIGYGEMKPLVSNASRQGRAKNRRIEFIVKGVE